MVDDLKSLRERYQPKAGKVVKTDRQLGVVRFSACGKFLAAGGYDGTVRRWDATTDPMTELPPLTGHGGWVQALTFHPDGRRLFTADSWGQVRCWPYADKDPRPAWAVNPAHDGWVRMLALSPDGQRLATCSSDRTVRVWSADAGKKLHELTGHKDDVFCVAFHPDGKSLVSGDLQGVVKHWDLAAGKCVRDLDGRVLHLLSRLQDVGGARCLVFDRAGATLACAGTRPAIGGNVQGTPTVLFFDWASGKLKNKIAVGNDGDGYVFDLHWHPAGFVMAVTSGNPGVGKFFFQRPGDAQPFFLATQMANCHSLAVHPAGSRLVVAATNAGSNGNGRPKGKNMEYPGNWSPLHLWTIPGNASKS
jgi:WD40 repeat protein